jgi:uncharacterized protein YpmS
MNKLNKNSRYFILFVSVGLMVLLVLGFNNRITRLRELEDESEEVSAVVTQLQATHSALETQVAYATSDAAVEDWAYEEAHMMREGDHPIVPLAPQEGTPAPAIITLPTPQAIENWQMWKILFFDASR